MEGKCWLEKENRGKGVLAGSEEGVVEEKIGEGWGSEG